MKIVLSTLVGLLATATPARAEINIADSIEWMTADADLIVRGTVSRLTPRKLGTADWTEITLQVSETLKGKQSQTVSFLYWSDAKRWQTSKADLLVFLIDAKRVPADRRPSTARALRGGNEGDTILNLADKPRAFTGDCEELATRDAILTAVRASATSKAKRSHRLDVPTSSTAYKALWGGSSVFLNVPIDAALERRSRGWLASKDLTTREHAVRALAYFKSTENIRRLKTLLSDPDTVTVTEDQKPPVRRFLVRKAAHDVLTSWSVPHARPILEQ